MAPTAELFNSISGITLSFAFALCLLTRLSVMFSSEILLKLCRGGTDIIPILKKKDPLSKEHYRPVSILSHMSKVFERLSVKLCGFRKNHNTQYSLSMLEKWKASLDKGEYLGVIFMDLSKAFDTINHHLLLAKLKAYGFSHNALAFMLSYLKNRSYRVNINNSFSTWGRSNSKSPARIYIGAFTLQYIYK